MWHKFLIVLASACPINPLFPITPEYIGPKTRATLTCIIDWHIKNNHKEFSDLAKSVWGIYTPFYNLEEFINELNKVQIIKDENEQSHKLDFLPAVNLTGLNYIFKPKKFKCKANNRRYGKIKMSYDMKLPADLDFSKVQTILNGCIYKIPPNMYQSIIESQVPNQVYNEIPIIMIAIIVLLSIVLSVVHKSVGKRKLPGSNMYTEFESILYMIVPFLSISLYEKSLYVVLVTLLFLLFFYFKNNRKDFNWPSNKELYARHALTAEGTFDFVTLFRVGLFLVVNMSISAVDFITFSPLFFKSAHEGMSLMDTAGGLFVISSALASSISNKSKNQAKDFKTMFKMAFKKAFLLILVGVIRTAITKYLNYRVPVREYGVMGNFFIVLGVVILLGETIIHFSSPKGCFFIAIFYSLLYDFLIYKYQLENLLNNNKRNTFILMNLECFLNIAGSLPLYLFAHALRSYLVLLDEHQKESISNTRPSTEKPTQKSEKPKFMKLFSKTNPTNSPDPKAPETNAEPGAPKITTLFIIIVVNMLLYVILGYAGINAVRSLSNLRFNAFIFSLACFILLLSILFTVYFEPYEPNETILMLNKNPLATFIYANVITGLINMLLQTKLMPMYITGIIFLAYSLSFIGFAFIFNLYKAGNLKLKIPEFHYETINYQHIELTQLNLANNNNINQGNNASVPPSSSRDGRMNILREKLDILRTKVGRMSNADIKE